MVHQRVGLIEKESCAEMVQENLYGVVYLVLSPTVQVRRILTVCCF